MRRRRLPPPPREVPGHVFIDGELVPVRQLEAVCRNYLSRFDRYPPKVRAAIMERGISAEEEYLADRASNDPSRVIGKWK